MFQHSVKLFFSTGNSIEFHCRRAIWLSFYVLDLLEENKFFPTGQTPHKPLQVLCSINYVSKVIYNSILFFFIL